MVKQSMSRALNYILDRIAIEASRLAQNDTITSREIQQAVRLVLPGELGERAVTEGAKAVSQNTTSKKQ